MNRRWDGVAIGWIAICLTSPGNWPATVNTAGRGESGIVAIAGELAAGLHGLEPLARTIQDSSNNTTRFLVLGRETISPSGSDKTSLLVSAHNRPGALLGLLRPFEENGISLTRIDSRPSKTEKWTYVFYIECEGHLADSVMLKVMEQLEEHSIMLKRLGSHPGRLSRYATFKREDGGLPRAGSHIWLLGGCT